MKILFEGEPEELIKFFCPTDNRQGKSTDNATENFWDALIGGLVKGYKNEHCPNKQSAETKGG